jgi:hypothetical protein
MGMMAAARRLDDRVLGQVDSPRARRRNRVLLVILLVWIPGAATANVWSVPVGLAVAAVVAVPVVVLVRWVSAQGPRWAERVQQSDHPAVVGLRRWDARLLGSKPSENRLLDFVNSLGNSPWFAPVFLGFTAMNALFALVYELAGRDALVGKAMSSMGWTFAAALISRVAWNRRCQDRR